MSGTWGAIPRTTTVVEVQAGPFAGFRAALEFAERLKGVEGIQDVRVQRFSRGRLVLQVRYSHRIPLLAALRTLEDQGAASVSLRPPGAVDIEMRNG